MKLERNALSKVCQAWDHNEAALKHTINPMPKMTPRSKNIRVKYHWCKPHVKSGQIEVHPTDTKLQKADIFRKGLAVVEFKSKRKIILGW